MFKRFKKTQIEKSAIWLNRVLSNTWQNIMRNKVLSIATILIISLMFFVFNLILALSYASDSVILAIGKKVDIRVEILDYVEQYKIYNFVNTIKKLDSVEDVIFVSKEEALENFNTKYPSLISFLKKNQLENPLPNVVRIIASSIKYNDAIINELESSDYSRIINQDKLREDLEQKSRNEKILNITNFIKRIGMWLNLIFAIVAILIIFNSINLSIHSHRHEINIMRLVGAKQNFIRGGYIFEGIFYAFVALLFSLLLSRLTLMHLSNNLMHIISNENLLIGLNAISLHFDYNFSLTILWQLFAAILIGLSSSFLAIEIYLKRKYSF